MEHKIEGVLAIMAAFVLMQSSVLNPLISVWMAIVMFSALAIYKFIR
jgi:hypothetical protein